MDLDNRRIRTVAVNASKSYDIKIGPGLLQTLGTEVKNLDNVEKVAIVSDSNVWPLYGNQVEQSLQASGFETTRFVFPAGEQRKNAATYIPLLTQLAKHHLTRSDLIVALGGGVVGDLAGFAAATYLRGIRYIQIPTTLLAMVDSSVGGKNAIDLPVGKNLVGTFWQPSLVLCDTDTLATLPKDIFQDGCAEVIKYAIVYDPAFFAYLEAAGLEFDRQAVIARCVELKRNVVGEDEFDTGNRRKLNLGHTIGHGLEASSHFTLSHGKSVAIGISIVTRASHCRDESRIIGILTNFGLPTTTESDADTLLIYALSDKKRSGSTVNLIIPRAIGSCEIVPSPVEEMHAFIEEGL